MDESIRILLIEDDPSHAELIRRAFQSRGDSARLTIAHTLAEARREIRNSRPTLIIADWRLPDGDSSELLAEGHDSANHPIIIMTSYGSEKQAVEAIKAGALDYIVKSSESMADMPHIAERAIEQWRAILNQERMQKALTESEAQFRLLAENSSDMISRHDPAMVTLYVSPACRNLLGYEPEELIGKPIYPLIHPDDARQLMDVLSNSPESVFTKAVPYRVRHKNGEYVWLETTAKIFRMPTTGQSKAG
jgi:PAS domain S-box-containing protein